MSYFPFTYYALYRKSGNVIQTYSAINLIASLSHFAHFFGERFLSIRDLDGNTRDIVGERFCVRKGDDRCADLVYQFPGCEATVRLYQLNETVDSKELACFILRFGYPVRIKEKYVTHLEWSENLLVDFPFTESQWCIPAVQCLTRTRASVKVDRLRVPTIHQRNPTLLQIEACVAEGSKAFEANKLPTYVEMDRRDYFFRLKELPVV